MTVAAEMFNAIHYARLRQQLQQMEADLEGHVKTDYEKVKAELSAAIAHWKAEVAALEAKLHPTVLAHLQNGVPPTQAVSLLDKQTPEPPKPAIAVS